MSKGRGSVEPAPGAVSIDVGTAGVEVEVEVEDEDEGEGEDDESGRMTEVEVAAAGFAVDVEENLRRLSDVVFAIPLDDSSMLTPSCRRWSSLCTGRTGYLLSYTTSPGPKEARSGSMTSHPGSSEANFPYRSCRRPLADLVALAGTQKVDSNIRKQKDSCETVKIAGCKQRRRPGRGLMCGVVRGLKRSCESSSGHSSPLSF